MHLKMVPNPKIKIYITINKTSLSPPIKPYGLIQIANTIQVQAMFEFAQRLNHHVTTKINNIIPTSKRFNLNRAPHITIYIVKHTLSMMDYCTKLDLILLLQSTRLTNFKFAILVTPKQSILTCMFQKSNCFLSNLPICYSTYNSTPFKEIHVPSTCGHHHHQSTM